LRLSWGIVFGAVVRRDRSDHPLDGGHAMKKYSRFVLFLLVGGWIAGMSPAAGDLLVASYNTDSILRYDGQTGAFIGTFATGSELNEVEYMTLGPDGNLYVSSFWTDSILRYDGQTGALIDTFADNQMPNAQGLTFGSDGDLYALTGLTIGGSKLQHYDGQTGMLIETLLWAPGLHGLAASDLTFAPDGNLYLVGNGIKRFDFQTGNLDLITTGVIGSHVTLGLDDLLYISRSENPDDRIDRFEWQTGDFIDTFNSGGNLSTATGSIFGPDGNLYVSSGGTDVVLRYNGQTGVFIDIFASGGGLDGPMALVFIAQSVACALPGDVDEDGMVDGEDIQGFLECLLTGGSAVGNCGCADIDGLDGMDINDVDLFVSLMLSQ